MEKTKELNLCEILKDCPKGITLYSPILGVVKYDGMDENGLTNICVVDMDGVRCWFRCDGKVRTDWLKRKFSEEVMLFPSKENRDWSTWKNPKQKVERFDPKTFEPFDKVLVRDYCEDVWRTDIFDSIYPGVRKDSMRCIGRNWYQCIPYNDDTKHLVGTADDAPEYYRYWDD